MTTYDDIVRRTNRFGKPSFARGFAGALDLFGSLSYYKTTDLSAAEQDEQAIAEDWKVVGKDLRKAFDRVGCR